MDSLLIFTKCLFHILIVDDLLQIRFEYFNVNYVWFRFWLSINKTINKEPNETVSGPNTIKIFPPFSFKNASI